MIHGTVTGYTDGKCRCTSCSDAWRTYRKSWMARRKAAMQEEGKAVLCPVCDRWFDSWRGQATHERAEHGRKGC